MKQFEYHGNHVVWERAEFAEKQVKEALECLKYGNRTFEAMEILSHSYEERRREGIRASFLREMQA